MDVIVYVAGLLLATAVFALCGLVGLLTGQRDGEKRNLTGSEVLEIIRDAKLFPVEPSQGWHLHSTCQGYRVWQKAVALTSDHGKDTLYSCYGKIKASSQTLLSTLEDISKYTEWNPRVRGIQHILPPNPTGSSGEDHKDHKDHKKTKPVQYDLVTIETLAVNKGWTGIIDWLHSKLEDEEEDGIPAFDVTHIARYWHQEKNGCCWMLELNEDTHDWCFLLAQTIQGLFGLDRSIVTAVYHPGNTRQEGVSSEEIVTTKLVSLRDYFHTRAEEYEPLLTLSLPNDGGVLHQPQVHPTSNAPKSRNLIQDFAHFVKAEQSEPGLFGRFKNMIEGKRDWYEREKEPSESQRKAATNILQHSGSFNGSSATSGVEEGESFATLNAKRGILRSNTVIEVVGSQSTSQAVRRRLKLDTSRKVKSLDQESQKEAAERFESWIQSLNPEDEKIQVGYRTLASQIAALVLAEVVKASNIDVSCSCAEQAVSTDGWIFCGVEKDVVILKKVQDENEAVHSYMGKGILPVAQKAVFETLRNPRTRYTYDETLKKSEVLHDFGGGIKIIHQHHEVSQLFKKEARDFCLLHAEKVDGDRHMITLVSIDWPTCPPTEGVTRAKFLPSGWIVEPTVRNNKPYSMVTYLTQIDPDANGQNNSNVVDELVLKQPHAIAHLRHYLKPHRRSSKSSSTSSQSTPRKFSRENTPVKALSETFASMAAALSPSNNNNGGSGVTTASVPTPSPDPAPSPTPESDSPSQTTTDLPDGDGKTESFEKIEGDIFSSKLDNLVV